MLMFIIPVLVMIVGLVMWLAGSPKASPIGERMFTCGLLVTLFVVSKQVIKLP
jgi:hypothetical protein